MIASREVSRTGGGRNLSALGEINGPVVGLGLCGGACNGSHVHCDTQLLWEPYFLQRWLYFNRLIQGRQSSSLLSTKPLTAIQSGRLQLHFGVKWRSSSQPGRTWIDVLGNLRKILFSLFLFPSQYKSLGFIHE